ncbi:hypothetical protein V1512DRAFT_247465 [Lipomyces arxii]|uniref:uncharacterized protein n=1 Tax=Lipomyces arxii TaxID=56418 RepID=UPI0034CD347A
MTNADEELNIELIENSYNKYAAIAARATRRALKEDLRIRAERREATDIRPYRWEDGKQGEYKEEAKK